jgi:hypothetical protein
MDPYEAVIGYQCESVLATGPVEYVYCFIICVSFYDRRMQ